MSPNCPFLVRLRRRGTEAASRTGRRSCPASTSGLAIARRYRDLVAQIAIDQGGADRCSEVRMQLIRRFASGAVLAEELEARLARGEAVDIAEHALLSSTLVRLAQRIGINRVAKDLTPSLDDYLRSPPLPDGEGAE